MVNRKYVITTIGKVKLGAKVMDGKVIGWQPLTLKELNKDIPLCITYLENIKKAMDETKEIKGEK